MLSVGIDFGGTNIAAGLVDEEGKILLKKTCKTGADRPADAIIFDMASLILSLMSDFGITFDIRLCTFAELLGMLEKTPEELSYLGRYII